MNGRTQRVSRRTALKITGVAGITGLAGCTGTGGDGASSNGDDYPSERITLVIPYGTAGGFNAYTRLVGEYLGEELGAPGVNYQNTEGAGGRTATREVYNADPDGYTMMLMNGVNTALQHVVYEPDYDVREMTYFPVVSQEDGLIGIEPDTRIESWDDFVEATNNNELKFGSESATSAGVTLPLYAGLISGDFEPERVTENFVQYPTKNEMVSGLRRGDINVMASTYSSVLPFVESDDVSAFMEMTAGDTPSDTTPDAVTLGTEGVEGAEEIESVNKSIKVFTGPPGMEEDLADRIRDGYMATFENDELLEEADEIDRPIDPIPSDEAKRQVERKIESNREVADLMRELAGE